MDSKKLKVKLSDMISVLVGLVGAVLLWLHIDPKGIVLYTGFLIFGSSRIVEFFILSRFERNNLKEILKFVTSVLILAIAGSHLLAGGKPLFGMLSLIILLVAFSSLEKQNLFEPETE